jgi:hypothetical protein
MSIFHHSLRRLAYETEITNAVESDNLPRIQVLLNQNEPHWVPVAFDHACSCGKTKIVEFLIQNYRLSFRLQGLRLSFLNGRVPIVKIFEKYYSNHKELWDHMVIEAAISGSHEVVKICLMNGSQKALSQYVTYELTDGNMFVPLLEIGCPEYVLDPSPQFKVLKSQMKEFKDGIQKALEESLLTDLICIVQNYSII